MKKIISLTLAVLMLCTLSIPVFAADISATYKSVTVSQDGEYREVVAQGDADKPGKIVIESGATVTAGEVRVEGYADLTVKSGATLRINGSFTMYDATSSMTIEEGAKVELLPGTKGKWFYIPGTLTVAGELTGEIFNVDISKKGYGSIEIQGNGVIDLYCEMEQRNNGRNPEEEISQLVNFLKKTDSNIVTQKDNRIIAEASHKFGEDERCVRCGALDPSHQHAYGENFRCSCGAIAPNHEHDFSANGIVCACGMVAEHDHDYTANGITCPCGAINPNHNHDFDNEKHTCLCGAVCAHVNGVDENLKCVDCGHVCAHTGICEVCHETLATLADIEEGDYIIYTALDKKKSMSVAGGKNAKNGGESIVLAENGEARVFTITKDSTTNAYIIKSKDTGLLMDTAGGVAQSGADIWQWSDNAGNGQRWVFENAGKDQYYIRSLVQLFMTADKDNINAQEFVGTGSQIFKLVKVDANGNPINKLSLGSALSEGNMAIIIAIAALVVGLGGGFFAGNVVTKKKTLATANGAPVKNDEDDE